MPTLKACYCSRLFALSLKIPKQSLGPAGAQTRDGKDAVCWCWETESLAPELASWLLMTTPPHAHPDDSDCEPHAHTQSGRRKPECAQRPVPAPGAGSTSWQLRWGQRQPGRRRQLLLRVRSSTGTEKQAHVDSQESSNDN